ncbi:MAG: YncE family protein, partial [Acidobacteriota bacterium]
VYVANDGGSSVTVIDGATNTTNEVPAGGAPQAVAVNVVTNKIYVADFAGSVRILDGITNATTAVTAGLWTSDVAVNPVTDRVYATNFGDGTVTVINGSTLATRTVPVGDGPVSPAANPVTNKIYVANLHDDTISVIDGRTNATKTVPVGHWPSSVAVNPVTNKVYVVNSLAMSFSVIDGVTDQVTATIVTPDQPVRAFANPVTNKVYIVGSNLVIVVDGNTNRMTLRSIGPNPLTAAVNQVTNCVFVPKVDATVTRMCDQDVHDIPLHVAISPVPGDTTSTGTTAFSFSPTSGYAPFAPPPTGVYFQMDGWQGPWQAATPAGTLFSGNVSVLRQGLHVLYAWADDGQAATTTITGSQSSPVSGAIAAYVFLVTGPPPTSFFALRPCRILDTRDPDGPLGGPEIAGGSFRTFSVVAAACGVPGDAVSISTNLTVPAPPAAGGLHIFAGDQFPTLASTIDFRPARARANNAIIQLASDGMGTIAAQNDSSGAVHLIVDVSGYFR